jgi:hypothetical protein
MNSIPVVRCVCIFSLLFFISSPGFSHSKEGIQALKTNQSSPTLSLTGALVKVFQNDYQLVRSSIEAQSFEAEAESKNILPDPIFFAAMQNIPTDTFDLDQEAMTQFRIGVKQMFPKGDSLNLNKNIVLHNQAAQHLIQKQRILKLRQQTEMAWLEAWFWQKNKSLIEEDRIFLTQILDFMQSVYQLGGNNQSDLIGAELELIKLDEKILEADRRFQTFRHELNTLANEVLSNLSLNDSIDILPFQKLPTETDLYSLLSSHPKFLILDENIAQLSDKVTLSEQDYEPQWGVELSYGYRQDMPNGMGRADLVTAGVSVQLPLFSKSQKSLSVRAIKYKQASVENERLELLQKVRFELENLAQQYRTTMAQRQLYEQKILPTLAEQKASAIQSYESDKGDFRVVTDLYIKEQSTRIKQQRLHVNEQLLISKMNYWLRAGPHIQINEAKTSISKTQVVDQENDK